MYTTFGSFKKAGACRDGNKRFLRVIENSSAHLPEGLETKIPVWLPLIMNPTESEDISWMFRPVLTYVHEEKDFEHLFSSTRHMILYYGLIMFLGTLTRSSRRHSTYWKFDDLSANQAVVDALIQFQNEALRVINANAVVKTDEKLQAAFRALERVAAIRLSHGLLDEHSTPVIQKCRYASAPSELCVSSETLSNVWSCFRMAVMEPYEGQLHSSITDQFIYTKLVMENIFELAKWQHFGFKVEKEEEEKVKTKRKSLKNVSNVYEHPEIKTLLPYIFSNEKPIASTEPKRKKASKKAIAEDKTSCIVDVDDDDVDDVADDSDAEHLVDDDGSIFQVYDRQYLPANLTLKKAAKIADDANHVFKGRKPELDKHGRYVLHHLPHVFSDQHQWVVNWVHNTFDTASFFNRLRIVDEKPLPETLRDAQLLVNKDNAVTAYVNRDETGEFIGGFISVQSPRLMLHVIKMLDSLHSDLNHDVTPARRHALSKLNDVAPEKQAVAGDDPSTSSVELPTAGIPAVEEPVAEAPVVNSDVVQLADAAFGSRRRNRRS